MNSIVALPLIGTPVIAAHADPDAELVALADRIKNLHPHIVAASQALDEADARYEALKPERSDALKFHFHDDVPVRKYANSPFCTDESVDALRGKKFVKWEFAGTEDELDELNPSYLDLSVLPVPGHEHCFIAKTFERKQRRADELISALDDYHAKNQVAIEQAGVTPLQDALEGLQNERDEITDRMVEIHPKTLKGLQALAAGIAYAEWFGDIERRPNESLEDELVNKILRALCGDSLVTA